MKLDAIKTEYSKRKQKYEKLKEEVIYIIKEELEASDIPYHMLDGRIKTLDSVITKAKRQGSEHELDEIDNIADICGVRIIYLFLSDVERIGKIIEKKFDIESKDDKVLSKPQEEFGYLSVHYVGRLPRGFIGPRYDDIKGLRFEIQVRTIAMHAWATISHYLDYKSPHSIPSNLRKDFYGLSALFYLADSHFELFFRKGQEAREVVEEKAQDISAISAHEINFDTLATYLKHKFPDRTHGEPHDISRLVEELIAAGYRTIGDLDEDLKRSAQAFTFYENKYPPVLHIGYMGMKQTGRFTDVGVVRISLKMANAKFLENYKSIFPFDDSALYRFEEFRKYIK